MTQLRDIALCALSLDEYQAEPKAIVYPTPLREPHGHRGGCDRRGVASEAMATPAAIARPDPARTSLTLFTLLWKCPARGR